MGMLFDMMMMDAWEERARKKKELREQGYKVKSTTLRLVIFFIILTNVPFYLYAFLKLIN